MMTSGKSVLKEGWIGYSLYVYFEKIHMLLADIFISVHLLGLMTQSVITNGIVAPLTDTFAVHEFGQL